MLGFIGRHMARELESRGYYVDKVDIDDSYDDAGLDDSHHHMDLVYWLREEADKRYDLVVHAAFNVGGRAAIDGKNMNFADNLVLDGELFSWAVETKQRRVLYFSSSAAYPVAEQNKWCAENYLDARLHEYDINLDQDLGIPDANYGWAKLTGERLAEDARRNGLRVSVVRPFSGYGEDQSLDYPFPSIVKRARAGDLSVWGPPGQCRDWIHVSDVVQGALAVVESETEDPVNLCTGIATEMGALATLIHEMSGGYCMRADEVGSCEPVYLKDKPTGVFYRVGNPDRFHQYYAPRISLEEGIAKALHEMS